MHQHDKRKAILQKIRGIVGDSDAAGLVTRTRIFCIEDGDELEAGFRDYVYRHGDHTSTRAFIFEPATRFDFTDDGELRHYSVGTILWRRESDGPRYCLLRGRTHPVGYYSFPAGHLERGEQPQAAALREAYEETELGIVAVASEYYEEEVREECRRGSDLHHWFCYVCECIGEPRLCPEGDLVGWFKPADIIVAPAVKTLI